MIKWVIGCSGFHYKHWKGRFYPEDIPQRKWFEFYCEHFNSLELNVTFYRFPRVSFLKTWYQKSPAGFLFAVKAPRAITHYKKFNDTEAMITSFYETISEGLQEKVGCVLFQLPPMFVYNEERLLKIINSLDTAYNNVLEFRHISWWNDDVYKKLKKNKIAFCGMSHPLLPEAVIQNTRVLYYRMHGVPDLYRSPYSIEFLQKFIDEVEESKITKKAFVYFNNDIDASAIKNAQEMMTLIKGRK